MAVTDYDNEPTFAHQYIPPEELFLGTWPSREFYPADDKSLLELALVAARGIEASQDAEIVELKAQVAANAADLTSAMQRITDLENAASAVLPTLELFWMGARPIPASHPTAALKAILEEV